MKQLINIKRFSLWLLCLICTVSAAQARTIYVVNKANWNSINAWVWGDNHDDRYLNGSQYDKLEFYGTWNNANDKFNVYKITTDALFFILISNDYTGNDWVDPSNKTGDIDIIKYLGQEGAVYLLEGSDINKNDTFNSLNEFISQKGGEIESSNPVPNPSIDFFTDDLYIVGEFNKWEVTNSDFKMTAKIDSNKVTWTYTGTVQGGQNFHFTKFGEWENELVATSSTINGSTGKIGLKTAGYEENMQFSEDFTGTITITQTVEGYNMTWLASGVVPFDLYIRGENCITENGLGFGDVQNDLKNSALKLNREKIENGYRYTWSGIITKYSMLTPTRAGYFNFGTKDEQLVLGPSTNGEELNSASGNSTLTVCHNNLWLTAFDRARVYITLTQTDSGWNLAWTATEEMEHFDGSTEELMLVDSYTNWDCNNTSRYMTRTKYEDRVEWFISNVSIKANSTFHFTKQGGWDYEVAPNDTNQDIPILIDAQDPVSDAVTGSGMDLGNWKFNSDFYGNIKLVQNASGWKMFWENEIHYSQGIDHTLDRYDLYIRGDNVVDKNENGWDVYDNSRMMHRVKINDGYTYTWQGTIMNQNDFNFGTDPKHDNNYTYGHLELGLSGQPTKLTEKQSTNPMEMFYGTYHNIQFSWTSNSEVRITLTQHRYAKNDVVTEQERARGWWTIEWKEVARPSDINAAGGVYLHGSELNNWDKSKRRAFVWDPASNLYVLKYKFENSSVDVLDYDGNATSMTSNALTNHFYIEAFDEKLTVENGVNSPVVTGKSTQLTANSDVGVDHRDNCMILKDKALEEVTLYYNPVSKRLRVEGDVSDEIDARKYTVYYKLTGADKNYDGSMKDIYIWAWGNGENDREVLSTLKNDAVHGIDNFDGNGNLSFPGIKISDPAHGKIINVNGETYIRYTLDIPEGQTTLGVIFSHSGGEQMKNVLDTDFQDGRIYGWNTVFSQGKQDFFAKVGIRYLDKNGNKAMLLLNTTDGNIYTLDGVDMNNFYQNYTEGFVQDWKNGSLLQEPLYAANAEQRNDINLSGEYEGFYIVRSPASTETNEYTQGSILDYTYYFTHNGGIAYHKTYNLSATEGQCTHIHWNDTDKAWEHDMTDRNYNQLTNKPMTFNSDEVDRLSFWFELSTGRLRVSREEEVKESTARIVLYFKNDSGFERPYIHVQSVDGKIYTSETRVKGKDGNIYTVGQAMHQDDSRLGVNDNYWRYELRVPDYELKKGGKKAESAGTDEPAMSARRAPMFNKDPFISPTNYFDDTHLHSNLIFTFTDGKNPTAPISNADKYNNGTKQVKKFADENGPINQMHYVPVVHGGIYTLDGNSDASADDLKGQVYLINAITNESVATLDQKKAGDYIFEGTVNLWNNFTDGNVSVYVTTEIDSNSIADGVDYGAGDSPKDLTDTINTSGVSDNNMVYTSKEPFTINLNNITKDDFNENSTMAVRVTINPTLHTGGIGFSLSGDDFQTAVEEIEYADAPVMWFNLQGARLDAPKQGLNIRVQGKKASKIWIR